ncbi:hypothetical protein SAMN03159496_04098 [Rhizobium sp. NFR07]|nr:hypothetical protein SAMN03159496_04098 [Rhizobium sp. NFR07]
MTMGVHLYVSGSSLRSQDGVGVGSSVAAAVAVGALCAAGIYGAFLGLAADSDSRSLVEAAQNILAGRYIPSRSFGNPLYEGLVAGTLATGAGLVAVNLLSLMGSLIAVGAAAVLARMIGATPIGVSAVIVAVALHPLMLTNSSALMETEASLALALAFCCLSLHAGLARDPSRSALVATAVIGVALVLTRIDAAILVVSMGTALAYHGWRTGSLRLLVMQLALLVLIGVVSISIYSVLNGGLSFLSADVLQTEPWGRRLVRAVLGVGNALQLVGIFAVLIFLMDLYGKTSAVPIGVRRTNIVRDVFGHALLFAIVLFAVRFALLPDELEYLLIPLVLGLVWLMSAVNSHLVVGIILALSIMQNVASIFLFDRSPSGELVFRPALAAGGLWQDMSLRRNVLTIESEGFRRWLAAEAGLPDQIVELQTHGPGFISKSGALVISRLNLYQIDNPRLMQPRYRSAFYDQIRACDRELFPGTGWRVLQRPAVERASQAYLSGDHLTCELVTRQ